MFRLRNLMFPDRAKEQQEFMRTGNELHRFFHAHGYRKVAKHAYRTIKLASERSRERILFNLFEQRNRTTNAALAGGTPGQPSELNFDPTGTCITNPFADSHRADGGSFGDSISAFSMEVYQSNETGENIAVVVAETPGEPTIAILPLGTEANPPAASA
ncbi:hypothetical protein FA95DRAFT_1613453 [Auriscalpium vulgare]|uniref:Uncharacterized protein n=1 Tax=Auriscalpium vulgare TaxID=40419 RepID=A0ACB8R3M6_9AGAM|nr:hypothetical protein FA95DRAFT_1613453 [Auriscalpium vulgare]